jgi:hypothetical protein
MSYSLDALSKKYLGIGKGQNPNIERDSGENMGWKGDARKTPLQNVL